MMTLRDSVVFVWVFLIIQLIVLYIINSQNISDQVTITSKTFDIMRLTTKERRKKKSN